ncbi:hypothetical protein AN416_39405 (plasmid) [Paraburkholderia caribensis]|nr:hypothetical protein AN416_39405 [Paraburkholderia caribensis]AUT58108.1 hypothetical protein C2L66_40495 [Paraburkholderia caribensis]
MEWGPPLDETPDAAVVIGPASAPIAVLVVRPDNDVDLIAAQFAQPLVKSNRRWRVAKRT